MEFSQSPLADIKFATSGRTSGKLVADIETLIPARKEILQFTRERRQQEYVSDSLSG